MTEREWNADQEWLKENGLPNLEERLIAHVVTDEEIDRARAEWKRIYADA
jgi:hypothetical protein